MEISILTLFILLITSLGEGFCEESSLLTEFHMLFENHFIQLINPCAQKLLPPNMIQRNKTGYLKCLIFLISVYRSPDSHGNQYINFLL